MPAQRDGQATAAELAAKRERRRRAQIVRDLSDELAGGGRGDVLTGHPATWSTHPVPYCGSCTGGETWPCPPVRAALDDRSPVAP